MPVYLLRPDKLSAISKNRPKTYWKLIGRIWVSTKSVATVLWRIGWLLVSYTFRAMRGTRRLQWKRRRKRTRLV